MKTLYRSLFSLLALFLTTAGLQAEAQQAPVEAKGQLIKLQSLNYPDRYLRHFLFEGNLTPVMNQQDIQDSTFKLVPGLAGSGVSFESVNYPGHFLRHQLFRLKLQKRTPDDLFRKDATFKVVPGLADPSGVSFQSVNYPGRFLRHRLFMFWLDERGADELYRKDATFKIVNLAAPVSSSPTVAQVPQNVPPAVPAGMKVACMQGAASLDPATTCPVLKLNGYTYWAFSYDDNRVSLGIVAYDAAGKVVKQWEKPGSRYVYAITVDSTAKTVTFAGQADAKVTMTWDELLP